MQEDAEVLRVSVRRAEQPEDDLSFHEEAAIIVRIIACLEKLKNFSNTRSAFGLILASRRHGKRLAQILLWQPQQALVIRPAAIEAFDDQNIRTAKRHDHRLRGWKPEC